MPGKTTSLPRTASFWAPTSIKIGRTSTEESIGAIDDFARTEPGLAASIGAEVHQIFAMSPSEDELRELILNDLHSGYTPEPSGDTYRTWLISVADRGGPLACGDAVTGTDGPQSSGDA